MVEFIKRYKIEFFIFTLAVIVRLAFFFICLDANGGNIQNTIHGQDGYFEISRNLVAGNGFSINSTAPFLPYSYGVPGYPYFLYFLLSLTNSYLAVAMIQLILGALIAVMGVYITRLILPTRNNIATTVGILLAISPYQILFSFIFYTETFFTILFGVFLISFFKFLKKPSVNLALLSGVFIGLATLTKATVQYVPIAVIAFSLWRFRGQLNKALIIKLSCFFFAFVLVLTPWVYRNYRTFDTPNLSSQMPFNLYSGLLPSVLAIQNHTSFAEEQKSKTVRLDAPLSEISSLSSRAIKEIFEHPVALVKLSMVSSITFFTHDGMLTFLQAAGITPSSYLQRPALLLLISSPIEFIKTMAPYMKTALAFVFIGRIFWMILATLFLLGIYKLWRIKFFSRENPEVSFGLIMVLYFMLTTMVNGLSVNARFRMPVEMIIFAIACVGLSFLYECIKIRNTKKLEKQNA